MNKINTHLLINNELSGYPVSIDDGKAIIKLSTTKDMSTDDFGLIHGGFIFAAADYAAMLAVNDPNVVLGSAEVKFLAPSIIGDSIIFEAIMIEEKGKKNIVHVTGNSLDKKVFEGIFTCFVPDKHVLTNI